MQSLGFLEEILKLDENLEPLFVLSIDELPMDNWHSLPVGLYIFCDELGRVYARHISMGDFGRNW